MSKPAAKNATGRKGPTVVSVLNLKGGVGKTTVTALLARYAASILGRKVLAVDLDPQANLSQVLMGKKQYENFMGDAESIPPRPAQPSIVELFKGRLSPSSKHRSPARLQSSDVIQSIFSGLDLVPSRFDFARNLVDSIKINKEVLADFICDEAQDMDLVLIDCAPTESILTQAAYHASGYVLIPVKTELFSTIGFPLMKKSLDDFRKENPQHTIDVCGILINKIEYPSQFNYPSSQAIADMQAKARIYKWPIVNATMTLSRGYPKMAAGIRPHGNDHSAIQWPKIATEIFAAINL